MKRSMGDEEFLEKLSTLMLTEGVAKLPVAEIAARMGCSRRRLYELAGSKEELFFLVVKRLLDGVLQQSLKVVETEHDLTSAISAYLELGVRAAGKMTAAALADLEASRKGRKLFHEYQAARAKWLSEMIDDGVKLGVFASYHSQVVTETILAAPLYIRRPRFLKEANLTMEEAFHELYKLFLNGLLKRPSPAAARKQARTARERA